MIDVSIIIVNYNCLDILDNCLRTLFEHTKGITFQIIIVDNNTTQGSVDDIVGKYKDVLLIKNDTNKGFAAANNQALPYVKGKYILYLNNDTVFIENVIKTVFDFAESLKEEAIIGCKLLNSDLSLQESIVRFPTIWNVFSQSFFLYKAFPKSALFNRFFIGNLHLNAPSSVDVVKGAFFFANTSLIQKFNGFDERFYFYSEETDLCYRTWKDGIKTYFFPLASIIHIGGVATDLDQWFKFKNDSVADIQFFQKHFHSFSFALFLVIRYLGKIIRIPLYALIGIFTFRKKLLIKSYYYFKQLFVYPKNVFNQRS